MSVEADPDTGIPVESSDINGIEPQGHQRVDDHLLDLSYVIGTAMEAGPDGEDRVADQLTRTVIGDVPTPVGPDGLSPD
jgi:hypothetical protein